MEKRYIFFAAHEMLVGRQSGPTVVKLAKRLNPSTINIVTANALNLLTCNRTWYVRATAIV